MHCSTSKRPSSARAARHRRQVRGDAQCARGGLPRGPLPAQRSAFLPQRTGAGAHDQAEGRGAHAEGDPRAGIARGMRQKGRGGGGVDHGWGKRRHLDMSKLEEMDRPNKTVGD